MRDTIENIRSIVTSCLSLCFRLAYVHERLCTGVGAYDCTYKEFNSLEEAKAFVSSNGLVKVESK